MSFEMPFPYTADLVKRLELSKPKSRRYLVTQLTGRDDP